MSIAFLLLSPIGVLSARFLRRFRWFPIHGSIQTITIVVAITGFAFANLAAGPGQLWATNHHRIGVILFVLLLLQGIGGVITHYKLFLSTSKSSNRPLPNWIHIGLGIFVQGIAYAQFFLGLNSWENLPTGGKDIPKWIRYALYAIIAVEVGAYLVGAFLWDRKSFFGKNVSTKEGAARKGDRTSSIPLRSQSRPDSRGSWTLIDNLPPQYDTIVKEPRTPEERPLFEQPLYERPPYERHTS
ncbi:hypothetical protein BT69DRAFT_775397 [Atractiella rhizophila]|nr:hypothetical protein BT69DRAFT_775397 [Atractiella rhizophila]